ncbi:MAG: DUF1223 domain-containing protein [Pseudomonadota bacterium]
MKLAPAALIVALATAPATADPVVVELFTSQGCSSCPPADAMLGELTKRDDVIALSLHVDYWDWIGWKDTFANPYYSKRQRAYASAAGSTVVYTPQFVIGGKDAVAGPSGMQLADLVASHQGVTGDVIQPGSGPREIRVTAGPAGTELVLVTVEPEAEVRILHGENAGRTMTYHNIVRDWRVLDEWDGTAGTVTLPAPPDGLRQVVLAQQIANGKPGAVLGAMMLE